MNDAALRELWVSLAKLERRVSDLEDMTVELKAHIRARLREEAEAREDVADYGQGGRQMNP